MKRLYIFLTVASCFTVVLAQAPQKISYQAIIRNGDNQLVTTQIGMQISILKGAEQTPVYIETHTPMPNINGLVTIEIGTGTTTDNFSLINWNNDEYYIKTETDPTGGSNYNITIINQILSVPYALQAKNAETSFDAVKLTGDQTIDGNKTFTGTITVTAPVNPSDATTKSYVDALIQEIDYLKVLAGIGTMTDIDGNIYKTIKIGTQVWMTENLKVTKYANGDLIGTTSLATQDISGETMPQYQWAYGGNESNVSIYGRLYTWYAITDSRLLCPTDWHIPTDAEWTTLTTYLGGESSAGGKLKETAATHWTSPNTGATNETGFTALPGGYRYSTGSFVNYKNGGYWWSSTEGSSTDAWCRVMGYIINSVVRSNGVKKYGYSVRCLKN